MLMTLRLGRKTLPIWLLLCCSLIGMGRGMASGVEVVQARTVIEDRTYQLNARIVFEFSDELVNALGNGVALPIEIEAQVFTTRAYVWDSLVKKVRHRLVLQYHLLSKQYIVSNLTTGALENFRSLGAALEYLGRLERIPLVEKDALDPERDYSVRLRAQISAGHLPVPLRLRAYLYPSWRLSSNWFEWQL